MFYAMAFTGPTVIPLSVIPRLRELDTFDRYFVISAKGNNFCAFLFAFLDTNPLLKKDLLQKERMCSQGDINFGAYPAGFDVSICVVCG